MHPAGGVSHGQMYRAFFVCEISKLRKMSEFKYKNQYGVIVICASEDEQKLIYDQLLALGLTLKVVVV